MNDTSTETQPSRVECRAAKDPAVRLFILAGMLIGFGVWCFADMNKYPRPREPLELKYINEWSSYLFNHGGAYGFTPLGVIPLVWGIVLLKRRLIADEEGIGYAGGRKVAWGKVERLDAARLENKGILDLYHDGGRRLRLDSWKLQNFKDLVKIVEQHLPAEGRQDSTGHQGADSA